MDSENKPQSQPANSLPTVSAEQSLDSQNSTDIAQFDVLETLQAWPTLSVDEHITTFRSLPRDQAEDLFLEISSKDQAEIYREIPDSEKRSWIRLLAPDDAVDLIQELNEDEKRQALNLLDPQTRIDVNALSAYNEDNAGGLMNPRFARLRPDMTVEEAIRYLRVQTRANVETIYYAYALDQKQILSGVVSLRQLFTAPSNKRIDEIMIKENDLVVIPENMDQEEVGQTFSKVGAVALPVVNSDGAMKGIITIDDIVRVVREEATEDIHKIGGMEALDEPYFKIGFLNMIKKRAGWLMILFIGEMFTATAMGHYDEEISKAIVLALFIPLIISSGGNSGSQTSTLIVRAIALGEVRLMDWWRVLFREIASGLTLGCILGLFGMARIYLWPSSEASYGAHYGLIALAVGSSLVGIVLWGTIAGSMLPFVLKRFNFDPATASAPLVSTLVDVTGIVIYFTVANAFLGGVLL